MKTKTAAAVASLLVAAAPIASAVTLSAPTLAFPDQQVFTTSTSKTLTLKNTSTKTESIYTISEKDENYTMTMNSCGKSLAAGKSCAVSFAFAPLSTGALPANLYIGTSQTKSNIALTGKGVDPVAAKIGPKKWHPGHYVQLPNKVTLSDVKVILPQIPPEIKGVMVPVVWSKVETSKGVYDFSTIKAEFNVIKGRGKRMVVLFQDMWFDNATPQCVPKYMLSDPIYEGGQQVGLNAEGQPAGCETKRWVPAVMDRIIAAHQALGKALDQDPMFEGVTTEESATVAPSTRAYVDQLKRLASALPKAYPTSLTNMWINWRTAPYTAELVDHLYRSGVGFGGPDTLPSTFYTNDAYEFFPQYAGRTYSLMAAQPTHLIWKENPIGEGLLTLDDVFHFAVNDPQGINATHLFWWWFKDAASPYDFFDSVAVIKANGGAINNACPENLICNTK